MGELLSISNTTGIYPEISGLYQREETPYLARPVWRGKNNKTFLIRYDDILKGWVLDKKEFDGDIVALRVGQYPTAVAKHEDAMHILQLEQMLMIDDTNNDKKSDQIPDDQIMIIDEKKQNDNDNKAELEDDEKKEIESNGLQKMKKRGIFGDGLWHIKGNVENSRIKVEGYTEREFDLEWEFRSLAAQM